jgi:hypothetical protein
MTASITAHFAVGRENELQINCASSAVTEFWHGGRSERRNSVECIQLAVCAVLCRHVCARGRFDAADVFSKFAERSSALLIYKSNLPRTTVSYRDQLVVHKSGSCCNQPHVLRQGELIKRHYTAPG